MPRNQITAFLKDDAMHDIEINMKTINCKSKSNYIEQAVEFYNGYLHAQNNSDYVSKVIISSIDGIMNNFEDRLSRIMFKQAVEVAKVFKLVSLGFKVSESDMEAIHVDCIKEVKKINAGGK